MSDAKAHTTGSTYEWQSWPFQSRPIAGVSAIAVIVVVSTLIALFGGNVFFGLVSLLVLFGSLNPFFSPTRFRLNDEGVDVFRWPTRKNRRWADIRSCFVDDRGLTLSPFRGRSWLEPYRGVRLLFDGNRTDVLTFVQRRLDEEVSVVDVASPPIKR